MTNTRRDTTVPRDGNAYLKPIKTIESLAIAAIHQSGHLKSASTNDACQVFDRPCVSGGFLLLNLDLPRQDSFALSLRLCGHRAFIPEKHGKAYFDLTDDEVRNFDYLFCDLTRRINYNEFRALRRICQVRKQDGSSIPKTCLVPQDWPSEFQRFVGVEFEAHITSCKVAGWSLSPKTIQSDSRNEDAAHEIHEGRTS